MIPMVIDGETCGRLEFSREGAYMLCRGRAAPQKGLVRLWLYGKGESAYLGVLQPDGTVRRRFSLGEFDRLPKPLEYCGNRPKTADAAPVARAEDVLWVRQRDGTLVHGKYIAFPVGRVRLPRGCTGLLRSIEGEDYVVFPC